MKGQEKMRRAGLHSRSEPRETIKMREVGKMVSSIQSMSDQSASTEWQISGGIVGQKDRGSIDFDLALWGRRCAWTKVKR